MEKQEYFYECCQQEQKMREENIKQLNGKNFLVATQQTHDNKDNMFWSYLSRIYKSRSLQLHKLSSGNKVLSEQEEIMIELHKYYSEEFKPPLTDYYGGT